MLMVKKAAVAELDELVHFLSTMRSPMCAFLECTLLGMAHQIREEVVFLWFAPYRMKMCGWMR